MLLKYVIQEFRGCNREK